MQTKVSRLANNYDLCYIYLGITSFCSLTLTNNFWSEMDFARNDFNLGNKNRIYDLI